MYSMKITFMQLKVKKKVKYQTCKNNYFKPVNSSKPVKIIDEKKS